MFTLLKKLFGKPEPQAKVSLSSAVQHEPSTPIPTVEVAHLSLAAIVSRLPDDLQGLVRQTPGEAATVALPVPTILKQLPQGAVRISLATLHRQAPAGMFLPVPPGDKRMVNVPLGEIFRHVSPYALKRRPDQRTISLPASGFNLFGNSENPYEIVAIDEAAELAAEELETVAPRAEAGLRPPPAFASGIRPLALATENAAAPNAGDAPTPPRVLAPPAEYFEPTPRRLVPLPPPPPPEPPKPKSDLPPLRLPLAPLIDAWPEEIKGELHALNGSAAILLPADDLSAGLSKGKVVFTWGEIRSFLDPALEQPSAADEATPLTLPLKIVAPAFLASAKPKTEARKVTVAADIPALFSAGQDAAPAAEAEATAEPDAAPAVEAEAAASVEAEPNAEPQLPEVSEPALALAPEPAPSPELEVTPDQIEPAVSDPPAEPNPELSDSPAPECEQSPAAPAVEEFAPAAAHAPETLGQIFGEPERQHWTPNEIVSRLTQLPGIAGAVVALQEGLLVAQSLPEDVKGEVVAAFLPQIFARLNQYAGEMKLGEVDDLLFTTRGAHCQIYRLGIVFFAVLGHPGQSLPWPELRLIADELAKQTQPA